MLTLQGVIFRKPLPFGGKARDLKAKSENLLRAKFINRTFGR
jgi:hypothetical protein